MIYLDHAATTPLDPEVLEVMLPHLREGYGNASSVHAMGRRARYAVETARETVAGLIGAEPAEIIFTSGATEANNLALFGVGGNVLTARTEHEAVLKPAEALAKRGFRVDYLPVEAGGAVTADAVMAAQSNRDYGLISVMHVNNETGAVNDIAVIARQKKEGWVHTDAVQSAGHLAPRVDTLGVDLMSLSAHKFYGPKGVGCLYVRGGVELAGLIRGGSQERGRRGGTENVAGIVGMAAAMKLAYTGVEVRLDRLRVLRQRLLDGLEATLAGAFIVNTPLEVSAPHILNIAFVPYEGRPVDGEMLLLNMDLEGVCVSSGSACTSGAIEPSHVLLAMGVPRETAAASVRFSLGRGTKEEEIDRAVEALGKVVGRMKARGGR